MTEEEIRAHAVRVVRDWVKDGVDPEYVATDWDIVSQEVNRDDLDEIVEEADRIMEKLANGKMPR